MSEKESTKRSGPGVGDDPWRVNEESRRRQLREDGRRPLAVNLAEGLALSEFLSAFPKNEQEELASNPMRLRELFAAAKASQRSGDAGE